MWHNGHNYTSDKIIEDLKLKRLAEDTALDGCRSDLSDVSFVVGKTNPTPKYVLALMVIVLPMLIRLILSINDYMQSSKVGDAAAVVIVLVFAAVIISAVFYKYKPKISVNGRTLSYNGNSFDADQISQLTLPGFGKMKVYSDGNVVATASYDDENSEMLIAWAKKCNIFIADHRSDISEL